MALITLEELEAFMGREFTVSEEAQAEAIIDAVSAVIEGETGCSFTLKTDDMIRVQADGYGIIDLLSAPVHDVVELVDIKTGEEINNWTWDGMQAVVGLNPEQAVLLTYTYGYESVPGDIKSVAKGMASRIMYNPSGLRQETVGAISVTYPGIGGEAGTINFSNLEKKILANYSSRVYSMRMRISDYRSAGLPVLTITNNIA